MLAGDGLRHQPLFSQIVFFHSPGADHFNMVRNAG
jgi:hypothetical protein